MIRKVVLIFKTHLDIGFTDYSANIVRQYLNTFIPKAIETAYLQKDTDCPFIWTTGSWLITEALEHDTDGSVDRAIRDGLIRWHALPFTSHTELMTPDLMRYGLSLSKQLDRAYGVNTIAAKMTDVPGHTIGIVPLLREAGVELMHIGVNEATPVPPVPRMFRWKHNDDSIAMLYAGAYGDSYEIGDTVITFGMTNDNLGPQGGEPLRAIYDEMRAKYPGAIVTAGTLNDAALAIRGQALPVLTSEIGDSWIHGGGTDPIKSTIYRAALRKGNVLGGADLRKNLLLVPEHTWGMDIKTFFPNDTDYTPDRLAAAPNRETVEASWAEQRAYAIEGAKALGVDVSEDLRVQMPDTTGLPPYNGTPSARLTYQLFTAKDYERYYRDYNRLHVFWSKWDFTKVNLPDYEGGTFTANVTGAWTDGDKKLFRMEFDEPIRSFAGLPVLWLIEDANGMEVRWFGKRANRLPEAFWLKPTNLGEDWKLKKLGTTVDPEDVIGCPWLHAVWGIENDRWSVENLDAPLAAPFGPHMLRWGDKPGKQDMHFNLYNNIWNTNFPMWFDEDARFRFVITKK